jgi:hypothetical protein
MWPPLTFATNSLLRIDSGPAKSHGTIVAQGRGHYCQRARVRRPIELDPCLYQNIFSRGQLPTNSDVFNAIAEVRRREILDALLD